MTTTRRKILIVEDDAFKFDRIKSCLERLRDVPRISIAKSVQAAVAILQSDQFDFILLDMSLPTHDLKPGGGAGTSLLSGGLEVIMELEHLKRDDEVIVITQYPEVEIEGELISITNVHAYLEGMFSARIGRVILYRHEYNDWESQLMEALGEVG